MIGQVRTYSGKRGFGFITGDDGKDYFVPYCNINRESIPSGNLSEGYTVEFTAGKNDKGYVASNVRMM